MRSANESELVPPVKFPYNVLAEDKADASIIVSPSLDIDLGVRPQQVA